MPVTPETLVQNVLEKKPGEFSSNFSDLVNSRIQKLVADKKVEIARTFLQPDPTEPNEETPPNEPDDDVDGTDDEEENPPQQDLEEPNDDEEPEETA